MAVTQNYPLHNGFGRSTTPYHSTIIRGALSISSRSASNNMIRSYTILSTNEELQTSPYVHELQQKYDIVLKATEPKLINFLFQFPVSREDTRLIKVVYDKEALEVNNVFIDCFTHQTLISTKMLAKDVGSMKISFKLPHHSQKPQIKITKETLSH